LLRRAKRGGNTLKNFICSSLNERKTILIDYLAILTLSLIPIWQMGLEGIWVRGDAELYVDPVENFQNSAYIWNKLVSTGYDTRVTVDIPWLWYKLLWATLFHIGFPLTLIQRIFLISTFAFLGWAGYYLMNAILWRENPVKKRIAALVTSLFLIFNPYNVQRALFGIVIEYLVALASLAFVFAFLINGLRSIEHGSKRWYEYGILIIVFSVPLLTMHAALALSSLFLLSAYVFLKLVVFSIKRSFKTAAQYVKFIFFVSAGSILLNSWWLMLYFNVIMSIGHPGQPYGGDPNIIYLVGTNLSGAFVSFLRLQLLLSPLPDLPYLSFWITSPFFMLTGMFLTMLVFSAVLFRREHIVLFSTLMALLTLGLSVGINLPLGFLYKLLWDHLLLFRVFYAPDKFLHITVLCYAILLGITVMSIWNKLKMKFSGRGEWMTLVAIMSLIFTNSAPILSGNFFGIVTTTTVPDYWQDATLWLRNQNGIFRIFIVPQNEWMNTWAKYVFQVPVIDGYYRGGMINARGTDFAWKIYLLLLNNKTNNVGKLLALLNVKYVLLVNETVSFNGEKMADSQLIVYFKSILDSQKDLKLIRTFGKLIFYKNLEYQDIIIYGTKTLLQFADPTLSMEIIKQMATKEYVKFTRIALTTSDIPSDVNYEIRKINSKDFISWKPLSFPPWISVTPLSGLEILPKEIRIESTAYDEALIYSLEGPFHRPFIITFDIVFLKTPPFPGKHAGLMVSLNKTYHRAADACGYTIDWLDRDFAYRIIRWDEGNAVPLGIFNLKSKVEENRWYHWTIVLDNSTISLYIDGLLIGKVEDVKYRENLHLALWSYSNQIVVFKNLNVLDIDGKSLLKGEVFSPFKIPEYWKDEVNVVDLRFFNADNVEKEAYLQIMSNIKMACGFSGLWCMPINYINLSNARFIRFWFKADSPHISRCYVTIKDIHGNCNIYDFSYKTPNIWQLITISLDNPTLGWASVVSLDFSKISGIQWVIFSQVPQNVTWYLGEMEVGNIRLDATILSKLRDSMTNELTLQYDMVNPTKYIVRVNADRPFIMIFSESFNEEWKISVQDSNKEFEHFIINFYANGWYIDKVGNFEIVLEYAPQKILNLGIAISTVTAIILIVLSAILCVLHKREIRLCLSFKKSLFFLEEMRKAICKVATK